MISINIEELDVPNLECVLGDEPKFVVRAQYGNINGTPIFVEGSGKTFKEAKDSSEYVWEDMKRELYGPNSIVQTVRTVVTPKADKYKTEE